nr:sensor histidine kinase [Azospirillum sp. 412522]
MADASAVFILFRNLIENALAHSPAGGEVTVSIANETLQVIDRGPGIAPADMPRLFTRFWRGSARACEGAGLGLSICQEIVLAHRWPINVRDASPGACFTITLG